jgi:hypothetical protein
VEFPRLDAVRAALTTLDSTGLAMEAVEVPMLFGRGAALDSARSLVTLAETQARQAVSLAQDAQFAPEAIESATTAANLLRDVHIGQDEVRAAGRTLRSAVEELRSAEWHMREAATATHDAELAVERHTQLLARIDQEGPASIAKELLGRDPESLGVGDWEALATISANHADALPMAAQREGAASFAQLADEIASGTRQVDQDVWTYFDAAGVAALDDATLATTTTKLLDTPASLHENEQWMQLASLLEDPRTPRVLPKLPARIGNERFASVARGIADGARDVDPAVQAAFDEFHVANLTARQLAPEARALLSRHSSDLQPHEWSRLAALLERDADATRILVPRKLGNSASLPKLARAYASETREVDDVAQRYFDAWHTQSLKPAELASDAHDLLARPDELFPEDWARLGAYLDRDADGAIIGLPRELPGVRALRDLVEDGANGYEDLAHDIGRYVTAGEVARMSPDDIAREGRGYVERGIDELGEDELLRLDALVRADAAGAIGIPKTLPGSPSFAEVAHTAGTDDHLVRYLAAGEVARLPQDELASATRELLDRAPEELELDEWYRLEALLRRDPDGAITGIPHAMRGDAPSIEALFERFAAGNVDDLAAGAEHWILDARIAGLDDAARYDEAMRLISFEYDERSPEDWRKLSALLASSSDGPLARLPRQHEGVPPIGQVIDNHLEYGEEALLQRYADAWNTVDVPPAERSAELAGLLGRRPASLTEGEWLRLGALLDGDVDRVATTSIRKIARTRPFAELVSEVVASGRDADDAHVQRYFDAWRELDDGAFRKQVEGSIEALAGGNATAADLARVRSQRYRVAELAFGRSAAEQSLIGAAMLQDNNAVGSLEELRASLQLIADSSPRAKAMPADLKSLLTRTQRLVDKNIERLDGAISDGYETHPDYAELGRIRENVLLIQRVRAAASQTGPDSPRAVMRALAQPAAPARIDVPETADEVKAAIAASDSLLTW